MKTIANHLSGVSWLILFLLALFSGGIFVAEGTAEIQKRQQQTVYVPVYSHFVISTGKRSFPFELSVNLSIRNTDPENPIRVSAVDYYNSEGELVRSFIEKPITLNKMASTYFVIEKSDKSGGAGANFLVKWSAKNSVSEPIVESVTFGSSGTHGLSFVSPGKVIAEK